jgi:nucleoside-diphosphate-sugar epimerase
VRPGPCLDRVADDAGVRRCRCSYSEQVLAQARHHLILTLGDPDGYQSSVHIDGAAVVAALDVPAGVYNVVDDEPLTKRDFAAALATAAGRTPWGADRADWPGCSAIT